MYEKQEGCKNDVDSKIGKDCKGYYFCCYTKSKMVDNNDCKKCPYYQFREGV